MEAIPVAIYDSSGSISSAVPKLALRAAKRGAVAIFDSWGSISSAVPKLTLGNHGT
jgi:hypothetical protein